MRQMRLVASALFALLAVIVCLSVSAQAQATYQWSMVAQATPDECFQGDANAGLTPEQVTANKQSFSSHYPAGLSPAEVTACRESGGLPKINQAYVWGLTKVGNQLWFSTVANTLCLVMDSFYGSTPAPYQNGSWVCDVADGEDYKPPRMFIYNSATGALTDLTPKVIAAGVTERSRLVRTFGLRSAGNYGGVVFFGGLYVGADSSKGVVMYAFDAQTEQYLGSYLFDGSDELHPQYTNIRQWHVISNQLFTGVAQPSGGAILRWTGSVSNPFSFAVVGTLGGDPAYFIEHKGNIYVSTWGTAGGVSGMSLYMSPKLSGELGLEASDALWTEVWNLNTNYEVEPSAVQGGGAIASYNGYLYWGTMHVPGTGVVAFQRLYPEASVDTNTFINTTRSIAIFRSEGFDPEAYPTPNAELLYGNAQLPKYDPDTATWNQVPNLMGQSPRYGMAGFGNVFNNYTWTMEVFDGKLYVGTMDWSFLATNGNESSSIPDLIKAIAPAFYGADMWVFPDENSPALPVSMNGLGNYTSYGIRTMVADSDALWIGMANPMNLRSDPTNNPGGWKLIAFPVQHEGPVITWANPSDISYGTPLSAAQLNATADVQGNFVYSPPAGAVLEAGENQTLSVTFTPTSSGNQWSKTVAINVVRAGTSASVTATPSTVLVTNSITFTAQVASATTGTPTGSVTFMDGTTLLGSAALNSSGAASISLATLAVGPHAITAVYSGDGNFNPSTSPVLTQQVQDFQISGSSSLSASTSRGGTANFTINVSPTYGNTFPSDITLTLTNVPAGMTARISPTTIAAGSGPQVVTVQVTTSSTVAQSSTRTFGRLAMLAFALLPVGLISIGKRRGKAMLIVLSLAVVGILSAAGCGGSKSRQTTPTTPQQPAQTYTMTLTASSGAVQHAATLSLTVQ